MKVNKKCSICKHLMANDECEYCKFEYDDDLPWTNDDEWDILNLDDDIEWSHYQILYRLYDQDIECLHSDIWFDNDIAYLIGAKANEERIARALKIHKEVIYNDFEHNWIIINLFKEKYLRGLLDDNDK